MGEMTIFQAAARGLAVKKVPENLSTVNGRRGGGLLIREPFTGAWQKNMEIVPETVLSFSTVFACITLIAADIGKLPLRIMEKQPSGIWSEKAVAAFSPVLRKPNNYQNTIKFVEKWISSKLCHGQAFIYKQRDQRGVVVQMHVLDPFRVTPLVASNGDVYYRLGIDNLAELTIDNVLPASEIIHDRMICLFHPLIGNTPIFACGLAAMQGVTIQNNSANFFANGSKPGGVLTAPGSISDETAARIKKYWDDNFSSANAGRVAVLGDGLKYEQMVMTAVDAQLIDQLKWSAESVASCFHVPGYMVGVGTMPTHDNIESLKQWYYDQCLQSLITNFECCLSEGLSLPDGYGAKLDLKALLRMDSAARIESNASGVKAGIFKPNEARLDENLPPVDGGDTPYLQQQNYSLAALAKRDAAGVFVTDKPTTEPTPSEDLPPPDPNAQKAVELAARASALELKEILLNIREAALHAS